MPKNTFLGYQFKNANALDDCVLTITALNHYMGLLPANVQKTAGYHNALQAMCHAHDQFLDTEPRLYGAWVDNINDRIHDLKGESDPYTALQALTNTIMSSFSVRGYLSYFGEFMEKVIATNPNKGDSQNKGESVPQVAKEIVLISELAKVIDSYVNATPKTARKSLMTASNDPYNFLLLIANPIFMERINKLFGKTVISYDLEKGFVVDHLLLQMVGDYISDSCSPLAVSGLGDLTLSQVNLLKSQCTATAKALQKLNPNFSDFVKNNPSDLARFAPLFDMVLGLPITDDFYNQCVEVFVEVCQNIYNKSE